MRHDGRIVSDAQAVYALAIHFGLLEPDERAYAGDRLEYLVREGGFRSGTGFAGTPFVVWALWETGHADSAFALLLQNENPSWLYAVELGATTIWERWDSLLPDGSVNPGDMTSFNHYALGAVVDWLYKVVAGIRPAEPGYSRVTLQPTPGPGLEWARGAIDSRRGRIESAWRREGDSIVFECVIPGGVEADVLLPDGQKVVVGSGQHRFVIAA
ncbi:Bacterial alpha-L-rhamnosidase [Microbacterium terrae]|uniref:alpha-L-rhamnosidase n=1 Tax=Microbacterium terrae TaxID=69369 RepID=A0A0M2GVG7_9MICO|nr:Bacterial alpha-L-rhamnosidase [Microbacterium terrae]